MLKPIVIGGLGVFLSLVFFSLFGGNSRNRTLRGLYHLTLRLSLAVPLFYLCILTSCLWIFFADSYPRLAPHPLQTGAIALVIATTYAFTIAAVFIKPQRVTPATVARLTAQYPPNHLIFFPHTLCTTCGTEKPARSKHCSLCGCCYAHYDHHCVWLSNCVGLGNYRYFMGFLVSNLVVMSYGLFLTGKVIAAQMDRGPWIAEAWRVMKSSGANKNNATLFLLCGLFDLVLLVFGGEHVRLIYTGVTTNELDKWGYIQYLIELDCLYLLDEGYVERVHPQEPQYVSLASHEPLVVHNPIKVHTLAEIPNVYDQGFWSNFRTRME